MENFIYFLKVRQNKLVVTKVLEYSQASEYCDLLLGAEVIAVGSHRVTTLQVLLLRHTEVMRIHPLK